MHMNEYVIADPGHKSKVQQLE